MKNKWITKYENLDCPNCKRSIREIYDADSDITSGIEEDIIFCPFCGNKNIIDENEETKIEDNQLTYEELLLLKSVANALGMRTQRMGDDVSIWEQIILKLSSQMEEIEK